MPRTRNCRECRYSLQGLPQQGKCPECGLYYDADYDYPTTLRAKLRALPRDLVRELHDAYPWFAERYLPSLETTARAVTVLLHSAILCTIGLVIADALTGGFGILRRRAAPPPTGPSLITEMIATTTHWAPLLLAVYALATAYQGMFRHQIHVTTSATVRGVQARAVGLGALAAGLALIGLFIWMRYLP